MRILIAENDTQIDACYDVIRELRPHLRREQFVPIVRELQRDGYVLACLEIDERVEAVAGFREKRALFCDKFLYVDDLVTRAVSRSRGLGAALLEWLKERARHAGCKQLHLDSGIQREEAHRFYRAHRFDMSGYHFRFEIDPL